MVELIPRFKLIEIYFARIKMMQNYKDIFFTLAYFQSESIWINIQHYFKNPLLQNGKIL